MPTEIPKPFKASTITGSDGKHYVAGPLSGCGYDSGTLYPEMRLSSQADVNAATRIANEAFAYGVALARHEMRLALGLKE